MLTWPGVEDPEPGPGPKPGGGPRRAPAAGGWETGEPNPGGGGLDLLGRNDPDPGRRLELTAPWGLGMDMVTIPETSLGWEGGICAPAAERNGEDAENPEELELPGGPGAVPGDPRELEPGAPGAFDLLCDGFETMMPPRDSSGSLPFPLATEMVLTCWSNFTLPEFCLSCSPELLGGCRQPQPRWFRNQKEMRKRQESRGGMHSNNFVVETAALLHSSKIQHCKSHTTGI